MSGFFVAFCVKRTKNRLMFDVLEEFICLQQKNYILVAQIDYFYYKIFQWQILLA